MDNFDTPQSPIPDNDWTYNTGAETPEHDSEHGSVADKNELSDNDNRPTSPDNQSENEEGELPEAKNRSENVSPRSEVSAKEQMSARNSKNGSPRSEVSDKPENGSSRSEVSDKLENETAEKDDASEGGDKDQEVDKLMGDIFGEDDSGDEQGSEKKVQQIDSDDDEPIRVVRKSGDYSDEEEDERPRHRWDFDEIMAQKKAERKKTTKRHRKDGGIDLLNDNDDQIKIIVDQMTRAAAADRTSNENRQPAFQKHKLLPVVKQTLLKQDLFEALLDNGMMSAVSEWLAPLPDKSLPSLEVRTTLLKILSDFPNLEQGILRQSGLGKAVMYLLKHPREVKENKQKAARLIREWSRPIFQLEANYSSMTRDERIELDLHNRKRRHPDDDSQASSSRQTLQRQSSSEEVLNPGQAGFVSRARVPKPSSKAYIHRPKPIIEGQFHGPSKARATTRFDIAQRGFKERTKAQKSERHTKVSIAGNKMEI